MKELVKVKEKKTWRTIAKELYLTLKLKQRTGYECRQRWHFIELSKKKKIKWSYEENKILFKIQFEVGNKWKLLTKYLPLRTEHDIKNHFYSKLRCYINYINKKLIKENFFIINRISEQADPRSIIKMIKNKEITLKNLNKDMISAILLGKTFSNRENDFNNEDDFYQYVNFENNKKGFSQSINKKIREENIQNETSLSSSGNENNFILSTINHDIKDYKEEKLFLTNSTERNLSFYEMREKFISYFGAFLLEESSI